MSLLKAQATIVDLMQRNIQLPIHSLVLFLSGKLVTPKHCKYTKIEKEKLRKKKTNKKNFLGENQWRKEKKKKRKRNQNQLQTFAKNENKN